MDDQTRNPGPVGSVAPVDPSGHVVSLVGLVVSASCSEVTSNWLWRMDVGEDAGEKLLKLLVPLFRL